jgi:hypothetical protein
VTDTCRWCDKPITHDGRGNWIHTTRGYTCRDEWGVLLTSSAAPQPGSQWSGLYRSGWTATTGRTDG